MVQKEYLSGNSALAFAVKLAQPAVVSVYPITPQTSIIEKIAEFVSNRELDCELISVESEHSALSACFGAACTGLRTFTATASQGLAYMSEVLPYVSGNRFPVVMAVVNRGMAAPWTIWGDHQDAISQRDTGWIQLYVENAQDALDTCLQAYRLAEDPEILTPVMVCLDGFTVSHTDEIVEIVDPEKIRSFLPPYNPPVFIDFDNPTTFSVGMPPDYYTPYKASQQIAMEKALTKIPEIAQEFEQYSGRPAGGLLRQYCCEDAEYIVVAMGSVVGTVRVVVEKLRAQGRKVGVLAVRSYRPFPVKEIGEVLNKCKAIGVLDRNCSYGYEGALCTDVKSALFDGDKQCRVLNYIAGLGGKDIQPSDIEQIFDDLEGAVQKPKNPDSVIFIGLR
jgi:pyruvate ferredoxin oxidoreductase alpha subunit